MHIKIRPFEAVLVAVAVLLISFAIGSAVVLGRHADPQQVRLEFLKACLQVVVVIVLGTAVKLISDSYQSKRNQENETQTFRRGALADLINAYSQIKQSRRLLRANGALVKPLKHSISMRDFYDSQMVLVSKAQLDLETILRQVETGSAAFSDKEELLKNIRSMETYLGCIVAEYESNMPLIGDLTPGKLWPAMPQLSDLVVHAKEGCDAFSKGFAHPYKSALQSIRADLLR
jgi:hypothetical protein